MARNPKWNQPLSRWKQYFNRWIGKPDSQELLKFNIFFDFRCLFGEARLVNDLQRHIDEIIKENLPFFFHMAKNILQYKVPIGLFGQIVTDTSGGNPNTLNIKEALMPVVNFARLYALQNHIKDANTVDRLHALLKAGILKKNTYEELIHAYDFLMLLRYRHQALAISENRKADNFINLKNLTHIELAMLKQVFSHIAIVQKKIEFDFPGAK